MPRRIEYSAGELIGDHGLIFLEELEPYMDKRGRKFRKAKFKCFCGKGFDSTVNHVKSGNTKSCGCYQKKNAAEMGRDLRGEKNPAWKGGVRSHYLYRTWSNMKRRCLNDSCKDYFNYGGRGIAMHEPWINDSVAFIEWTEENLGQRPEGYSMDRINNDGNYEPGNLRWASDEEQNSNRRKVLR